jgi:hypothetical protein
VEFFRGRDLWDARVPLARNGGGKLAFVPIDHGEADAMSHPPPILDSAGINLSDVPRVGVKKAALT